MDDMDKTKKQLLKELFKVLPKLSRDDLEFLLYDAAGDLERYKEERHDSRIFTSGEQQLSVRLDEIGVPG